MKRKGRGLIGGRFIDLLLVVEPELIFIAEAKF
jgi:hypothetical protein